MPQRSPLSTLATLRRLLLAILLFGFAGLAAELLLMGHDEDAWQVIPLAGLALAMLVTIGMLVSPVVPARLFRATMVLLIVVGALGSVLHYRANREFKLEMDPSLGGLALFWSVIRAKAPPALAPGTLALFGLLGLASTFRLGDDTRSQDT